MHKWGTFTPAEIKAQKVAIKDIIRARDAAPRVDLAVLEGAYVSPGRGSRPRIDIHPDYWVSEA